MDELPNNKIIDFQIMRINKNAQKICRCDPPSYVIDTKNRLIQCDKCNAYIEPFEALIRLSENIEWYNEEEVRFNEERNKLIDKKSAYVKEINQLHTKRFRMNVFRTLQNEYMSGMVPLCPHCEKAFDPTEIRNYVNKKYCDYKKKKSREEKISYIHKYKNKSLETFDETWEALETYTDEELDKEIEKIKERLGDD